MWYPKRINMDAFDETVAEDVDWVDDDEDADADADDAAKSSGGSSSAPLLLCEAVLAAGAVSETLALTYHINTLGFIRRVMEQAGWKAARSGTVSLFSWWDERRFVHSVCSSATATPPPPLPAHVARRNVT